MANKNVTKLNDGDSKGGEISCPNEAKGPYWFNEVPPEVYFNIDKFKDGIAQLYQQKWQRDILDEQLDIQQRQILRNQRAARVYYNPVKPVLEPKNDRIHKAITKERQQFKRREQMNVVLRGKRSERKMCAIYGVDPKAVGASSEEISTADVFSASGKICQAVRHLPPYQGPHAYNVLPMETIGGSPGRDRFQVKLFRDKMAAYRLQDEDSGNVKQYHTTPLAIWRQHRFASPEGCDFRELKEQLRVAKYKAMERVQTELLNSERVALAHAKLTSHFRPVNANEEEGPDCTDYFQSEALMKSAREQLAHKMAKMTARKAALQKSALEERAKVALKAGRLAAGRKKITQGRGTNRTSTISQGTEGQSIMGAVKNKTDQGSSFASSKEVRAESEVSEAQQSEKTSFFEGQPDFAIEDEYLEDLIQTCRETREKVLPSVLPRPIGEFIPDPRDDPKYAICFEKEPKPKFVDW